VTDMTADKAAELRKPFPKSAVGKLPKAGILLDYVGHAAVTDRLLAVDPEWTWEPLALDENGLPTLDRAGNLWIRLTICGVTRVGVGDGKSAKEIVGDALRNAAMRFGVALDLWSKEELEHSDDAHADAPPQPEKPKPAGDRRTEQQSKKLAVEMKKAGLTDREEALAYFGGLVGRTVESTTTLTKAEASKIIDTLINANSEGVNPTTGAITTRGQIDATNTDPWAERQ
jgi:hypothetical protein